MREYPWFRREPHWEHRARQRVISSFAALAPAWLESLSLPASLLSRKGVSPELEAAQDGLKHLDSAASSFPSHLLGSRTPDEYLELLSRAARIRSALVLDQILKKDPSAADRLKTVSFEAGRRAASAAASELQAEGSAALLPGQAPSVRGAFLALVQRSFAGLCSPGDQGMLVERLTDGEASWVDLDCPHRDQIPEVGVVADCLCDQISEWRSGFCAGWDDRLRMARLPDEARIGRCRFILTPAAVRGAPGR